MNDQQPAAPQAASPQYLKRGMFEARRPTPAWAAVPLFLVFVIGGQALGTIIYLVIEAIFRDVLGSTVLADAGMGPRIVISFLPMFLLPFLWSKFFERRPFASLGFRPASPTGLSNGARVARGLGIGAGAAALIVGVLAVLGQLDVALPSGGITGSALVMVLLLLAGFAVQGTAEELIYRGFLTQAMYRQIGLPLAVLVQAVLFAVMHRNFAPIALLNLFLVAVLFAVWAVHEGNLWGVSAFHAVWNWMLTGFFGGAVSGKTMEGSLFVSAPAEGSSPLLTGGDTGIEGGLVTTVVILALLGLFGTWLRSSREGADLMVFGRPSADAGASGGSSSPRRSR